jgi:hypothetical protein
MSERPPMMRRSHAALILVILLMTTTAVTLVHWHSEWSGQRCEVCSLRQIPLNHAPVGSVPAVPFETEVSWQIEAVTFTDLIFSHDPTSRAPPRSILFTI